MYKLKSPKSNQLDRIHEIVRELRPLQSVEIFKDSDFVLTRLDTERLLFDLSKGLKRFVMVDSQHTFILKRMRNKIGLYEYYKTQIDDGVKRKTILEFCAESAHLKKVKK